ncbi:hypothetical protein T02_8494 [Trichinella nativa]|nr:hypothetical protein T02_4606 [Trichinella nativa]KRZ56410.1 hypothetical protein T02_8494 [Trichinella nativa]
MGSKCEVLLDIAFLEFALDFQHSLNRLSVRRTKLY